MKRRFLLTVALIFLGLNTASAEDSVEHFFKQALFNNIKISPDGKNYAFTYQLEGTSLIAFMNRETKKAHAYEYNENDRIINFHWANDHRVLVEVQKIVGFLDNRGGPRMLYAIDIDGKNRKKLFDPAFSRYRLLSLLEDDPNHALISTYHFSDEGRMKIHKININNGKTNFQGGLPSSGVNSVLVNKTGDPRLCLIYEEEKDDALGHGEYSIYYKKPKSDTWEDASLEEFDSGENFNLLAIENSGKIAYISSNLKTNTDALYQFDLSSGELKELVHNPIVDIGSLIYGGDDEVIGVRLMPEFERFEYIKTEHEDTKLLKHLSGVFKNSSVYINNSTADNSLSVIYVNSDINPGEFFLYNRKTKEISQIASSMPWIKSEEMNPMDPVMVTTRDNLPIYGYVTLPKGKEKQLPAIILPHGGPHGVRDTWGFNPEAQFLSHHGYAVLQINFRGSGGYGSDFLEKGYKQWGQNMQDDITDATRWLIQSGIADKDRICIYGGSYGGYATLSGVVKEPDLYQCGLGYVGVYDLPTMKKRGDIPKSEGGRKFLDMVLGEDEETLIANSPARNVEKIKAALFIAHGSEDVRVPMAQYDILKKNLDRINKPFKSMVRKEGHGYQKDKNKYDFYRAALEFFNQHTAPQPD